MKFLAAVLLFLLALFSAHTLYAATRLVSPAGTDAGDCTGAPCLTIQFAVDQAVSGDTVDVAAGVYKELLATGVKTLTFLGAQRGVDARTRAVPPAEESILDGAGLTQGILLNVGGADSVVDGFTFQNGLESDIRTSELASGYQIINNIFQDNSIGLSPACNGASPTVVRYNLFRNNAPLGAIYNDTGSKNITINDNSFVDNPGSSINLTFTPGVTNANVTITDNEFTGSGSIILLAIDTGTISGNSAADFAPSASDLGALFIGGGDKSITVTEDDLINGPGIGIHVADPFGAGPNLNVAIHQNNISQFPGGSLVVDAASHTGPVEATDNYFDGLGGPGVSDCTGDVVCEPDSNVPFSLSADLSITKEVLTPLPVNPGDTVEFQITVVNNGPEAATNVRVLDVLSGPFEITTVLQLGTTPCTMDSPTVTSCLLSSLDPGQTVTGTFAGAAGEAGSWHNLSAVESDVTDTNIRDNFALVDVPVFSSTTTLPVSDLAVTKTADSVQPKEGDDIHYTVTVTNHGPDDATNVVVGDIAAGSFDAFTLPDLSTDIGECTAESRNAKCTIPTLPAASGQNVVTFSYTLTGSQAGGIVNTVVVGGDVDDPDTSNNKSGPVVVPVHPADGSPPLVASSGGGGCSLHRGADAEGSFKPLGAFLSLLALLLLESVLLGGRCVAKTGVCGFKD